MATITTMTDNIVDEFGMAGLYPAKFPEDVPTAHLETLSTAKLINAEESEMQRLVQIMRSIGFFYLDLTDHEFGKELLRDAVACCKVAQDKLRNVPLAEKLTYKTRPEFGVFDLGYIAKEVSPEGEVLYHETCNMPATELLIAGDASILPPWLSQHAELFQSILRKGNELASLLLKAFEKTLDLAPGELTSIHQLQDPSGDFLRLLRYPAKTKISDKSKQNFPAHKDYTTVSMLFNWLGGLQIPCENAEWLNPRAVTEESWRWVKPVPGTIIVNGGEALELLTNKVLKSGLHRVMLAPGQQAEFDKYSVLLCARPRNDWPMIPLRSSVIPEHSKEQQEGPVENCKDWTANSLIAFMRRVQAQEGVTNLPTGVQLPPILKA